MAPKDALNAKVSRWGDGNCDNGIDMADAVIIMQSLANPNKYQLTDQGKYNADVYEAGTGITTNDAQTIQKYLLGLVKTLPESYSDNIKTIVTEAPETTPVMTSSKQAETTTSTTTTTKPAAKTIFKSSFDSSSDSWSGRGATSVEVSSDSYYSGKSLYVSGRSAEWNGAAYTLGSDFVAGQTYSFSAAVLQ